MCLCQTGYPGGLLDSGDAYEREVGNLKKFAATMTEPHHYIIVTYEEESDIEVDGVAISVVPLMKFLLET